MPSSPGYVRNIPQEEKTAKARGEVGGHDAPHAQRMRARRLALKLGMIKPGSKKDIDHVDPLVKGGTTVPKNLRAVSEHDNRSYPRTKNAGMK